MKIENVNHPSHYQREGKKECIEEIREKYGDYITCIFCLTNAYKYLYRAGAKEGNSAEQDIAKAKWYWQYCMESTDALAKAMIKGNKIEDSINLIQDLLRMFVKKGVNPNENNQTEL